MNAERFHAIARTLKGELSERNVVERLQHLFNALQGISQTSNASTQGNLAGSLEAFYKEVTDTTSDSFTPTWRQVLVEIGGEELFGKNLKQQVQEILANNQMTPVVAYQQIQPILTRLRAFEDSLNKVVLAFENFKIGFEELRPGEAEIALLIPRAAVENKLGGFANELKEMEFILNTLSEVATGRQDDLKIRTMSSSGLLVFLAAPPVFAAAIAKAVDLVVGAYKKILDIKKLELEIKRLEMPEEISEKTKEYANTRMAAAIETFTVEIIKQYPVTDKERKHELTNAVTISLNRIANRIDHGFNFEVRIEPLTAPPTDGDEGVTQAVQVIRAASDNMQYMKLEGPPILALPEETGSATEGDGKTKKRGGPK